MSVGRRCFFLRGTSYLVPHYYPNGKKSCLSWNIHGTRVPVLSRKPTVYTVEAIVNRLSAKTGKFPWILNHSHQLYIPSQIPQAVPPMHGSASIICHANTRHNRTITYSSMICAQYLVYWSSLGLPHNTVAAPAPAAVYLRCGEWEGNLLRTGIPCMGGRVEAIMSDATFIT